MTDERITGLRLVGAPDTQWPRDLMVGRRITYGGSEDREVESIERTGPGAFRLVLDGGKIIELANCPVAVLMESAPREPLPADASEPVGEG